MSLKNRTVSAVAGATLAVLSVIGLSACHGINDQPQHSSVTHTTKPAAPKTVGPSASVDGIWQFTTDSGCVVTYTPVKKYNSDMQEYMSFDSKYYKTSGYHWWKVTVDNRKGSESCSLGEYDPTVVTKDGKQLTFSDMNADFRHGMDEGDMASDDDYTNYLQAHDNLFGETILDDTKPGAKTTTYTVVNGKLKPFVSMYIQNVQGQRIGTGEFAKKSAQHTDNSNKALATQTFKYFKATVLDKEVKGKVVGYKVEVCVVKLGPDPQGNKTRVSRDPWYFAYGTTGAGVPANTVEPSSQFGSVYPAESLLAEGQCVSGWLTYNVGDNQLPNGMIYTNSYGEQATFSV